MRKVRERSESIVSFQRSKDKLIANIHDNIGRLEGALAQLLILREAIEAELVKQRQALKSAEAIDVESRESGRFDGRYVLSLQGVPRAVQQPSPVTGEEQYEGA